MSTENKAIVRRLWEEFIDKGNLGIADEIIADNFVNYGILPAGEVMRGREAVKQYMTMLHKAFPDGHFAIEDQIAEGDKVVTRWRFHGTHKGEFQGIAPTGKQVTMTGIEILRLAGGKVVEDWDNFDALGMMQQLGVVPSIG